MNRLLIALILLIATHSIVGFLSYQWAKKNEAQNALNVITNNVENHNEDQTELQDHTTVVQSEVVKARTHNEGIKNVAVSVDCDTPELRQLWHETRFTRR